MARDWLFEIGVEELPPTESPRLAEQLRDAAHAHLQAARLDYDSVEIYHTPRRLTLLVGELAERQPDTVEEARGPAKHIGFDEAGNPTQAAEGFARGQGATVDDLVVKSTDQGEYLFLDKRIEGRDTPEVLSELAPQIVQALAPSETMRWDDSGLRFIRPIRWLVCLYGDTPVDVELGRLRSGTITRGHRLLGEAEIEIPNVARYVPLLNDNGVILDPEARRAEISSALETIANDVKAHPALSEELHHEIANNLEHPAPVLGQFPERFLELPREVLETTLVEHQKFVPFAVGEKASPYFVGFRDGSTGQDDIVRRGYERVVIARLEDSAFFFDEDRRTSLEELTEGLNRVVYQEQLGTIRDKVERMRQIARRLVEHLDWRDAEAEVDQAVRLSKADLLTQMVGEFPDLEGRMGGIYGRLDGHPDPVCDGVYEHYQPKSAADPSPETPVGIVVSLADKLDTVVGSLLLGEAPTGSRDPLGIRRKTNGIARILVERDLDLDLDAVLKDIESLYAFLPEREPLERVRSFVRERLGRELRERHEIPYDVVDAVVAVPQLNPLRTLQRARAIQAVREDERFRTLVHAFERVANITRDRTAKHFHPQYFTEDAEQALWRAALKAEGQIEQLKDTGDFAGMVDRLLALQEPIDAYFEDVLVMANDHLVRENRLAFLAWIRGLFHAVGDLSRLVVEGERDASG